MGERHAAKATAGLWCTAVAVALIGCAPDPTPTPLPTATGFASEAEAFAAAEATYRAYVDALNHQYAGRTGSDPTSYLADAALEEEVAAAEEFKRMGIRLTGTVRVASFSIRSASDEVVDAVVCLDVHKSRVLNDENQDVTPTTRGRVVGLDVAFKIAADTVLISNSSANDSSC
ncbi:hypothetical protein [Microbacterium sp. PA5]|uniref:hypothetical protein n=1 Tax=Microbacterium sp. PA5 TaxID=3416654 RepID=UPI003CE84072